MDELIGKLIDFAIHASGVDGTNAGGLVASSLSAIVIVTYLVRRVSQGKTEYTKDRAEEDVIANLQKQRDDAVLDRERIIKRLEVVDNERVEALTKVGALTSEVSYLRVQMKELKELVEQMNTSLQETREKLQKYIVENAILASKVEHCEQTLNNRT